jgi:hypothetical protein
MGTDGRGFIVAIVVANGAHHIRIARNFGYAGVRNRRSSLRVVIRRLRSQQRRDRYYDPTYTIRNHKSCAHILATSTYFTLGFLA